MWVGVSDPQIQSFFIWTSKRWSNNWHEADATGKMICAVGIQILGLFDTTTENTMATAFSPPFLLWGCVQLSEDTNQLSDLAVLHPLSLLRHQRVTRLTDILSACAH